MPKVALIYGRQGAGKTVIGERVAKRLKCDHIEASDVVREIAGKDTPRTEMHKTNERTKTDPDWLGRAIWNHVDNDAEWVVITGVREHEVRDYLEHRAYVRGIWIYCPYRIRYERLNHTRAMEWEEFNLCEEAEGKIGLDSIIGTSFQDMVIVNSEHVNRASLVREIVYRLYLWAGTVS